MRTIKQTKIFSLLILFMVISLGLSSCSPLRSAINLGRGLINLEKDIPQELVEDTDKGVVITRINEDSPAEEAGLIKGDVILKIDDIEVNTVDEVCEALEEYQDGDQVQIVLRRGSEAVVKTVKLGQGPDRAYLGASLCCEGTLLNERHAEFLSPGMKAYIIEVVDDSPADEAGLESGDMIMSLEGVEFEKDADLSDILKTYEPGDEIIIEVLSGKEVEEVSVDLGENPDDEKAAYLGIRYQMILDIGFNFSEGEPGFLFHMLPGEEGWQFKDMPFDQQTPFFFEDEFEFSDDINGFVVYTVADDSPAEEAGIKEKDVITELDGDPVENLAEFVDEIAAHDPGDEISLTIIRSGEDQEIQVNVSLGEHPEKEDAGYLGVTLSGFFKTKKIEKDWDADKHLGPFEFQFKKFKNLDLPFGEEL